MRYYVQVIDKMAGSNTRSVFFLLCIASIFGIYCVYNGYLSTPKHDDDFHEQEYNLAEWKQHLKQHLHDKPNYTNFEYFSNKSRAHSNVQNCTERAVKLSTGQLPAIGLASFPGSGNTWTRHLIQQMTGLGTASEYCDKDLEQNGFPFECYKNTSRVIAVKTHESRHYQLYNKLVLLIRNPFDAFLSMTHVLVAGHTNRTELETLKEKINEKFEHMVTWFISLTGNTIDLFHGPVYILQYDELKRNMEEELRKLAAFLDVNVSQSDIECTVKLQEGHFHRKTNFSEHLATLKAVYSQEQLVIMREVARYSENLIKRAYGLSLNIGGQTEQLLF